MDTRKDIVRKGEELFQILDSNEDLLVVVIPPNTDHKRDSPIHNHGMDKDEPKKCFSGSTISPFLTNPVTFFLIKSRISTHTPRLSGITPPPSSITKILTSNYASPRTKRTITGRNSRQWSCWRHTIVEARK
mmetsp:Transcript_39198/g.117864  ORF Transcript_39198/g.117864 Transcript_39198/m.117864 type:complete len:132 (-) Transcript_39198:306-701(-)